jgi:peroxiredoxin
MPRFGGTFAEFLLIVALTGLCGCGGGEQPAPPTADVTQRPAAPATAPSPATEAAPAAAPFAEPAPFPTTASTTPSQPQPIAPAPVTDDIEIPFAQAGTLESRLFEITQLVAPPAAQKEIIDATGEKRLADRTSEEIAAQRKANLQKVVALAGEIIAGTHSDAAKVGLFNNAVHYLCAAHVELALMGEAKSARQLSETADAIYGAKPDSPAAIEAAARLLELAQRMGDKYGQHDAEWIRAHATQARLFANRFPLETSRCVTALLDSGRACERVGLHAEARLCYQLLADKFGDTPFAAAVAAILRRMNLPGSTLAAADFAGSTIDGDYLTIEQYRGKHVLIAFWNSDSPTFQQDFAKLQEIQQQQGDKLAIIGVNLDTDELAVDTFLEAHPLKWRQLFDSDPARRGTMNTVAAYYGVATVPMYWLIDPQGRVLAAPADLKQLPL